MLKKTVPLIKEYRSTPEEVIFQMGELNYNDEAAVYFIEKGTVELYYLEQTESAVSDSLYKKAAGGKEEGKESNKVNSSSSPNPKK